MPYIGHEPTNAGSFIEIDDFSSTFNGAGDNGTDVVAFTLQVGGVDITPNTANVLVMLDGVLQQPPAAYSISGSTITFTEAPASGTDLYAVLIGQSASVGQGTVGASELKVSGNGSSGQVLASDGDGTFTWTTDTENYLPLAGGALTGAVTTNSTFDGVDIATRDGVLTSTTTTANAALPKAGGTMTGNIAHASDFTLDVGGDITLDADGGDIIFKDGGTAIGKIYADGDAGAILHLDSDSGTSGISQIRSDTDRASDGGHMFRLQAYNQGAEAGAMWILRGSTDAKADIVFNTSNAERLRIDEDGKLTTSANTTSLGALIHNAHASGYGLKITATDANASRYIATFNDKDDNVKATINGDGSATFAGIVQITDATDSNLKLSAEVADEVRLISINDADNAYKALKFYGSRFEFLSGPIGIGITAPETHGVTAGIHLADDYEIGFGNGANSRPDFGMSGDSSNLSIYCGEGSDTADILINTNGELGVGVAPSASGVHIYNDKAQSANLSAMSGHQLVLQTGSDTNDTASMGFYASGDGYLGACLMFERTGNSGTGDLSIKVRNDANETSGDEPANVVTFNDDGDSVFGGNLYTSGHIIPDANNSKALGQDGKMWDVLWTNEINASADGVIYMANSGGTVQMDGRVNFKDIIWGESTYGFRFYRSDLGVQNFRIADNSDVTGGHGSYHTSSDETLKKNISTISSGLDKVNAMRGVEFKWKKEHDPHPEGETNHQRVNLGFIAQELEAVVPEVVNTNSVTGLKAVLDANQLTAVLVEAIKELSAKVEALENA